MKKLFLITLLGLLFSCHQEQNTVILPEGAIPITYGHGWIFPVKLYDTIPGNFLFDTGCLSLFLDSLYLSSIPLDTVGKTGAYTLYGSGEGKQETKYIRGPLDCSLDTLSSIMPYAVICQLKPTSGKSLDGIVGWDYLKDRIVEFNVDGQYIRLISPDSLHTLQGYKQLPLIRDGYWWYIKAKVAITDSLEIEGEFFFDTGYTSGSSNILFTTAVAEQNNFSAILADTIAYYTNAGGFGGKSRRVSFRAKSITIGDFEIKAPIASYSRDTAGILSVGNYRGFYKNHNGLFGVGLLEHFDVIIDFPHKQLYLRPSKNFDKEDKFSRTGFSCIDRTDICDGLIVKGMEKQQNAEKAGIRLEDTITHINKKAVTKLPEEEIKNIMQKAKSIDLTIRRGNEILQIKLPLIDKNI